MGKLLILLLLAAAGYVGYRLFIAPPAPKEATFEGYTKGMQRALEKSESSEKAFQVRTVQDAVQRFRVDQGRFPASLEELREKGYLDRVPSGVTYDPATGAVQ